MHVSDTDGAVLQPVSRKGLHPDEVTIAEVLKSAGYATACIGKWHLGDQPEFLPTRQGFDAFFGIPYSDDMTKDKRPGAWPELPLMRGERVIEAPADRDQLVKRCTIEAIRFIEEHSAQPVFLYLAHTMPGSTPHPFSSERFRGQSGNGAYGDAVEELDWSTGEILLALKRLGLEANTLVVWTSDNGAVKRTPPQGRNAPYRGWAYDTSEGAMRVPCVMRWPGRIAAGAVSDAVCSTIDMLPTFAALAAAPLPSRTLDGHDLHDVLFHPNGSQSPWDEDGFFYYQMDQLQAVRAGDWKLYLPLGGKFANLQRKPEASPLALYDVRHDVSEQHEVSAQQPGVVERLTVLADKATRRTRRCASDRFRHAGGRRRRDGKAAGAGLEGALTGPLCFSVSHFFCQWLSRAFHRRLSSYVAYPSSDQPLW